MESFIEAATVLAILAPVGFVLFFLVRPPRRGRDEHAAYWRAWKDRNEKKGR